MCTNVIEIKKCENDEVFVMLWNDDTYKYICTSFYADNKIPIDCTFDLEEQRYDIFVEMGNEFVLLRAKGYKFDNGIKVNMRDRV